MSRRLAAVLIAAAAACTRVVELDPAYDGGTPDATRDGAPADGFGPDDGGPAFDGFLPRDGDALDGPFPDGGVPDDGAVPDA